jgi:hypothetical protein
MATLNIVLSAVLFLLVAALCWQNRQLRRALDAEIDDAATMYWHRRAAKTLLAAPTRKDIAA